MNTPRPAKQEIKQVATVDSTGWQGWGISLGLHALVASTMLILWPSHLVVPVLDPFRWQVHLVQLPSPEQAQPVSDPVPAKATPDSAEPRRVVEQPVREQPKVRDQQQVVAKSVLQRASEQSRPAHQRNDPIAPSRLMTQPTSVEHARALPATQSIGERESKTVQVMPSAQEVRGEAEPRQDAVQSVEAQAAVPNEVKGKEAVQSKPAVHRQMRTEGIAGTVTAPVMQHTPVAEQAMTQPEMVQAEPVLSRQSAPVVNAVQSVGQVRAHYGWLKADLMAYIERMKRYPQFALDNKWEGRVVVRAVILADGKLTDLSVVESSGHEVLDHESLELLKRISPLPLKHELGAPQVTLRIPINYGIR